MSGQRHHAIATEILRAASAGLAWPSGEVESGEVRPGAAPRQGASPRRTVDAGAVREALRADPGHQTALPDGIRVGSTIQIDNVDISGPLNLDHQSVQLPVVFSRCRFLGDVSFSNSRIETLTFEDCTLPALVLNDARAAGSILISNCSIDNVLEAIETIVDGNFSLYGTIICGEPEGVLDRRAFHRATRGGNKSIAEGALDHRDVLSTVLHLEGLKLTGNLFLERARIVGHFDISGARISGQCRISDANIDWNDRLAKAETQLGLLSDPRLVRAETARIERSLTFARSCVQGCIDLREVRIGGQLDLRDARLESVGLAEGAQQVPNLSRRFANTALEARGIRCERSLILRRAKTFGVTNISDATIGGRVDCRDAEIRADRGDFALSAIGLKVSRSLLLGRLSATGTIDLNSAVVDGRVDCTDARLTSGGTDSPALRMSLATLGNSCFIDGLSACGDVDFENATVRGVFSADGISICPHDGTEPVEAVSLSLERTTIDGELRIRDSSLLGTLDLSGASIGGDFLATGKFNYGDASETPIDDRADPGVSQQWLAKGHAIKARGIHVSGSVSLGRDEADRMASQPAFEAFGRVSFKQATIDNTLSIIGARFSTPIYTRVADARNRSSRIMSRHARRAEHEKENTLRRETAIDLSLVIVRSAFVFEEARGIVGHLNLRHAKVDVLRDDRTLWSKAEIPTEYRNRYGIEFCGSLILDNFRYASLTNVAPPEQFRDWLECQPLIHRQRQNTRLQPWTQLSDVLHASGFEIPARRIRHDREKRRARSFPVSHLGEQTIIAFQRMVGFGFRPWYGIIISAMTILIGAGIYTQALKDGMIRVGIEPVAAILESPLSDDTARLPADYPSFNPIVYSADRFIPFLKLGQEDKWSVRTRPRKRVIADLKARNDPERAEPALELSFAVSGYKLFSFFQAIFGFVLTTLTGLAFAGFVHRRKD